MIDIHTHKDGIFPGIITVENKYPGDGFGAFFDTNYYSVGLHPWHIKSEEENAQMLEKVEQALKFEHVIAVGESGLDKISKVDFELQQQVFMAHIKLSEKFNKPMIIHCVKAYNEIFQLKKKSKATKPWILHSYNGNIQTTSMFLEEDIYFSFGNLLFHEKAKALNSFKMLPLNKIFLETDELSMSIEEVYKKATKIKGIKKEEIIEAIQSNFNRIFLSA